jgi:hypothetical protein
MTKAHTKASPVFIRQLLFGNVQPDVAYTWVDVRNVSRRTNSILSDRTILHATYDNRTRVDIRATVAHPGMHRRWPMHTRLLSRLMLLDGLSIFCSAPLVSCCGRSSTSVYLQANTHLVHAPLPFLQAVYPLWRPQHPFRSYPAAGGAMPSGGSYSQDRWSGPRGCALQPSMVSQNVGVREGGAFEILLCEFGSFAKFKCVWKRRACSSRGKELSASNALAWFHRRR